MSKKKKIGIFLIILFIVTVVPIVMKPFGAFRGNGRIEGRIFQKLPFIAWLEGENPKDNQERGVKGVLAKLDAAKKYPIDDAEYPLTQMTGADGRFSFEVKEGIYSLELSYNGVNLLHKMGYRYTGNLKSPADLSDIRIDSGTERNIPTFVIAVDSEEAMTGQLAGKNRDALWSRMNKEKKGSLSLKIALEEKSKRRNPESEYSTVSTGKAIPESAKEKGLKLRLYKFCGFQEEVEDWNKYPLERGIPLGSEEVLKLLPWGYYVVRIVDPESNQDVFADMIRFIPDEEYYRYLFEAKVL